MTALHYPHAPPVIIGGGLAGLMTALALASPVAWTKGTP